jgi:hypothetical protein
MGGTAQLPLPQKKCDTTIYRELPTVAGEKVTQPLQRGRERERERERERGGANAR